MINTIITYDNTDYSLGNYFNSGFLYIDALKHQSKASITGIDSKGCFESTINKIIPTFNQQNFVFVGLSHGSDDGMSLLGGDNYINVNNSNLFKNSFFYSTSCHVGRQLGNILLANGCRCFIGYTDIAQAPISGDFVDIFIECESHALKNFFLSTKSIGVLFEEMKSFIDAKFLEIASGPNIIAAMALLDNKNCMVLIGDDDSKLLTSLDFDLI